MKQDPDNIVFPEQTHFLKRERLLRVNEPSIPKDGFYYTARADGGNGGMLVFGNPKAAFKSAAENGVNLLWAH
jgi:hypothetical protein